jgi:hypothetical protein
MRWNKDNPKHKEKKWVRKFLWLPLTIGFETRWLEYATIERTFYRSGRRSFSRWYNTKFLNG